MRFRDLFFLYILIFIALGQSLFSDDFLLSQKNIRDTMEKMFSCHIENREFSPLIVRRSFKIYIQQFDPNQVYLMKGEVEPFLSLNDQTVKQVIQNYRHDRFPEYVYLNQVIEKAIIRNRQIRKEQAQRIISEGEQVFTQPLSKEVHDYPIHIQELEEKIYIRLIKQVKYSMQKRGVTEISPEIIQRILDFYEKKTVFNEQSYLSQGNELNHHYFTLHLLKTLSKSLDAHSGYYSPTEAYEIRANLKKEFSGVGIVLQEDFDGICVIDLINGGPADRSQTVEIGDYLIGLNEQSITDKNFDEVLKLMTGQSGEKLTLHLKKKANNENIAVPLIREKIIMNDDRLSVDFEPFGDGLIAKVHMPGFYDNGEQISVEKDLREALRMLRTQGNIYGLILDLRENSGGFLTQAIKVSAMFINGGIIVVSKYANGEISYTRDVDGRHYYSGPFVVLVSKASASASEVVAGALQDHGVALIVGDDRSYGKGSMQYQTITDEKETSFFKVTVGRYYTASGCSPQMIGVKSDIHVPTVFYPYNIGERFLQYPIANDQLTGEVFKSLHQHKKGSFKANLSIPYLTPLPSRWRQMLTQLQDNSQKRLESNQNFQFFLKGINGSPSKRIGTQTRHELVTSNFGMEDLQMKEAVEIIKDMLLISKDNQKMQ